MCPVLTNPKLDISSVSGKRIVITAHELESTEHRGISAYTKSLVKVLSDNGCEVWLLTEFFPGKQSKKLKKINSDFIYHSYLLEFLARGYKFETTLQNTLFRFLPLNIIFKLRTNIRHYILSVRLRFYPRRKLLYIKNLQNNSPYFKLKRLNYLTHVKGFICARRIYYSSKIRSILGFTSPVKIDLKGFDAYISTSPLNIRPINVDTYIQSIHDLIPLEYDPKSFPGKVFSIKLLESLKANRIFISNTTKKKFKEVIKYNTTENRSKTCESVVLQVPTLDIDKNKDYNYYYPHYSTQYQSNYKYELKPLKYILFNASVDPRKNLSFLIESYIDSMIHEKDIKLVIVGKLNKNSESEKSISLINELNANYIKRQYKNKIITTGYIDDEEKTILYLNSLAMVNPSLIEGLGLPVLDSACLGLKSIVSDCDAHKEISRLYDFSDYLVLEDLLYKQNWINSLISLAEQSRISSIAQEDSRLPAIQKTIKSRIDRYLSYKEIISNNCLKSISSLFNT